MILTIFIVIHFFVLFQISVKLLQTKTKAIFLRYDRPLYSKNYLGFGLIQFYTDLKKYKKVNHNENGKNHTFSSLLDA